MAFFPAGVEFRRSASFFSSDAPASWTSAEERKRGRAVAILATTCGNGFRNTRLENIQLLLRLDCKHIFDGTACLNEFPARELSRREEKGKSSSHTSHHWQRRRRRERCQVKQETPSGEAEGCQDKQETPSGEAEAVETRRIVEACWVRVP